MTEEVTVTTVQNEPATIALVRVGEFEAAGTAVRDQFDPFDRELGEQLALGRALRSLGRKLLRDAWTQVRQNDLARAERDRAKAERESKRDTVSRATVDAILAVRLTDYTESFAGCWRHFGEKTSSPPIIGYGDLRVRTSWVCELPAFHTTPHAAPSMRGACPDQWIWGGEGFLVPALATGGVIPSTTKERA